MIDCFQMESDVDNPINVVHVCDIINHELIVAAQNSMLNGCCYDIKKTIKANNCRTDQQSANDIGCSTFRTIFDGDKNQGVQSLSVCHNMKKNAQYY